MAQPQVMPSACVGRDAQLTQLHDLYRSAQRHGEQLAIIEGPAGVGKSRVLSEFKSRVRLEGGVVLEGRCEPGSAFGPFAEIAQRALRFLEEVSLTPTADLRGLSCRSDCHRFWYQHAQSESEVGAPNAQVAVERRLRFFETMSHLLHDVARVRAPVVLLDGLERADLGTLQLLYSLLDGSGPESERASSLRALFVASVRSDIAPANAQALDELARHTATRWVRIAELDEQGVRAYLQSPELVARVLKRTGGIPDAIDLLLDGDPLTPNERLERKLASLSPTSRRLVSALAVLERPSDFDLLTFVSAEDELGVLDVRRAPPSVSAHVRKELDASELLTRSIVEGRLVYAFAREIDRERAYQRLDDAERRSLHRRCMDALRFDATKVDDAARHALAAGDLTQAIPLGLEAARSLAARHAHGEAAAFLEMLAERAGDRASGELRAYLADLYRVAGDYPRALEHATTVASAEPTSHDAARRVGELLTLSGEHERAAEALELARNLATKAGDRLGVVQVETTLAELCYQRALYDAALEWASRAMIDAERLAELPLEIQARNTFGKVHLARRDVTRAGELFETNRAKASIAGLGSLEAQALTNLGVSHLRRQDLDGAEAAFSRAIEVATAASDTRERAIATENLAVLAHLARSYERAKVRYHEAVALLKRLGNKAMLARVANNLGELYLSLGEVARARALCEFATHMGGAALPPSVAGEGLLLRGRVDAATGHVSLARASFDAALEIFKKLGEARVTDVSLELARLALVDGDVASARTVVAEMPIPESSKRAAEVALVAAEVDRAAGLDALPSARRALELAERAGDPEIVLPALLKLSRAFAERREIAAASAALGRAREIDSALCADVPADSIEAWNERPTRRELVHLEAKLATLGSGDAQRSPSSPPPAPAKTARNPRWKTAYPDLVGDSGPLRAVLQVLDKVAPTDALVLVRGESGTGKELIAEALHRNSPRRDKPLVKVNCAALVETLLLSELFGHERGAFTGAQARKKGRFELADGGTLFLDEIGDISPKTQVALLRVLQEREFERVGGTQAIKVDVRIVAATHRDLERMVREGAFREDLYYRLRGVMIEMPSLRQRSSDIPVIAEHLLGRIGRERAETPRTLSPLAAEQLARHAWPGNVRELENVLRSATLFADGTSLEPSDFAAFEETFRQADPEPETSVGPAEASATPNERLEERVYREIRGGDHSLFEMKKTLERECIVRALRETDGNITQAAMLLGMKRPRLSQLVKQYGLAVKGGES